MDADSQSTSLTLVPSSAVVAPWAPGKDSGGTVLLSVSKANPQGPGGITFFRAEQLRRDGEAYALCAGHDALPVDPAAFGPDLHLSREETAHLGTSVSCADPDRVARAFSREDAFACAGLGDADRGLLERLFARIDQHLQSELGPMM